MFKDESGEIVPAIVSEELWERANEVLNRRSKDVKRRQGKCNHPNLLTGKLVCTHCGRTYYRRDSKDTSGRVNSKWVCSGKINNGADSCPSFPIYEEELKPVLYEVFQDTSGDVQRIIDEYTEIYRNLEQGDNVTKALEKARNRIDFLGKKKSKLLEYNVEGKISDQDFLQMNQQNTQEIEQLHRDIAELEDQLNSREEFKKQMDALRRAMEQAQEHAADGIINKDFIDRYIDRIYATPESDDTLRLEVKLFTGESCEKFLSRLRKRAAGTENLTVRSGHTFKKMIQSYENGLNTSGSSAE